MSHAVVLGGNGLIGCLCFTAGHARGLLPLLDDVGSTVMISSKAVYVDAAGQRVLNSADPDAPSALQISRTVAATTPPP